MNRYYFSRRRKTGDYQIIDRQLETRIATTDWREAADLICNALNQPEVPRKVLRVWTDNQPVDSLTAKVAFDAGVGPVDLTPYHREYPQEGVG
jgi:hypothetical protein